MVGFEHVPVLLSEAVDALRVRAGGVYVDCTLGRAGHAEAILSAARCRVVGIDRDPAALAAARERLVQFGDRFTPVRARFSQLEAVLDQLGLAQVDGVLADLGVSSPQLDDPARGFSVQRSGPIDMRMDPDAPVSAADLVNDWEEVALVQILRDLGEERHATRVARAIVTGRPWRDTVALAEVVGRAAGGRRGSRIHPATRTFQALRMAVNDELGELDALLHAAVRRLAKGGRVAVISFHSLEDRAVKRFLAHAAGRDLPRDAWGNPVGEILLERPDAAVVPSEDDPNPRARSARLRAATRS